MTYIFKFQILSSGVMTKPIPKFKKLSLKHVSPLGESLGLIP